MASKAARLGAMPVVSEDTRASDEIFGGENSLGAVDEGRVVAKPVPLTDISPDPRQPRRVIPKVIKRENFWTGRPASMTQLFDAWIKVAQLIISKAGFETTLSYKLLLDPADEETPKSDMVKLPVFAELWQVADLARNIREHGLDNPIKVAKQLGNVTHSRYVIESGERRYFAHWLLYAHTQDEKWLKIAAVIKESLDVWKQASENSQRQELNAVGMARQYAILLMDILEKAGHEFEPITAYRHEQGYYKQAVEWDTPKGKTSMLANAMGLANTTQLRFYRQALRLPLDVWEKADTENWSISRIREEFKQEADEEPEPPPPQPVSGDTLPGESAQPIPTEYQQAAEAIDFRIRELTELITQTEQELAGKRDVVLEARLANAREEREKLRSGRNRSLSAYIGIEDAAEKAAKLRLMTKINTAVSQNWITRDMTEVHQFVEVSEDPKDTRIMNKVTGEIFGGQQKRPFERRLSAATPAPAKPASPQADEKVLSEKDIQGVRNLASTLTIWQTHSQINNVAKRNGGLAFFQVLDVMQGLTAFLEACPIGELDQSARQSLVNALGDVGDKLMQVYDEWWSIAHPEEAQDAS